ncbi:erythrocyte membrane protein 1, EMP1 [Plasmodium reichenowi]|uniref:Erythrocyte membrane protein 1, EMP1 n=1 Tax=Plasmodium reichenowi TaxID=5854 RepID=A0A060RQJ4_PLARE|nr:erythrocyte membrane protein 1, EMP1 [Plasmodium reichenowi]
MGTASGGAEDYKGAKEFLDEFGQKVHAKVNAGAKQYYGALHGDLSKATYPNDERHTQSTSQNPCDLQYDYHTNVTVGGGKEYPCKDRPDVRFSDTEEAQCGSSKISGSDKTSNGGACAPYRRLNLCDKNLENINDFHKIKNTNNLLLEVCLAAKYEGASISADHPRYKGKYYDSNICTELARSFADIGDIIRGKDLYRRDSRTDKLEENLKNIFGKIHNSLDRNLKSRYNDTQNYYQLREDWWDANRAKVWQAITCNAGGGKYFRATCGSGNEKSGTLTGDNCRCKNNDRKEETDQVPTYFDYVPQYLRWFEEWAEDFCRKRKHKLENAKKYCRGENGEEKYCSGGGHDCTRTVRARGYFVRGNECTNCSFLCGFYKKWIAKQKEEFEKQKNKCEKEISSPVRTERAISSNYEGYDRRFYEEFKSNKRGGLNKFLELLNKENECTKITDKEEGEIDFSSTHNNDNKTFHHSNYCEECPECGVEEETFQEKKRKKGQCDGKRPFEVPEGTKHNVIGVLSLGDEHQEIIKKINEFCTENDSNSEKLTEKWKCYHGNPIVEVCTLEKKENSADEPEQMQQSFHDFFYFWVGRLLKDSIEWRDKLKNCINDTTSQTCKNNKCNSNCECYKRWITKKKNEWGQIKEHFGTQKDLHDWTPYDLLEDVLELDEVFEGISKAYGDANEIQGIKSMLQKKKRQQQNTNISREKTLIDYLLDHEMEEAETCLEIHDEKDEEVGDGKECVEEGEKFRYNPCATPSGNYPAMVNKVAVDMHIEARKQLGISGRKALKADASKGEYNGRIGSDLNGKICNINEKYSNANSAKSKNPCGGKGNRFDIGVKWETGKDIKMKVKDAYMPPRRRHICTSNLEYLFSAKGGNFQNVPNGKASDSFLGDVLLAANKQGEDIKSNVNNNNNGSSICRAMKYSFADIGDIIKGTDLWDGNDDAKTLQNDLVEIFKKIKDNFPNGTIKDKYKGDTDTQLKQLRADWWEANRYQVWKAMKCAIKNDNIPCSVMPVDDYIPQRLRWMTEWAEWYCKYQSQEYNTLQQQCGSCMRGQCDNQKCEKCKNACGNYTSKIKPWEDQWKQMNQKYQQLYGQAETNSGNTRGTSYDGGDPDYKQVVDFLTQLIRKSAAARVKRATGTPTNSPYATAAGYIHQELGTNMGCETQILFCNTSGRGKEEKDKCAFKDTPHDHKEECACQNRKAAKKEEVCNMVKELLQGKDGETEINGCRKKENNNWTCNNSDVYPEHTGACLPPRRQSLCLHDLTVQKDTIDKETLRDSFIRCVAKEIHFLWHKYKKDKNVGTEAERKLESGEISEDFKRIMYYTFADYKDIFFGTDMCAKSAHTCTAKNNIYKAFGNVKNGPEQQQWWEQNKSDIWHGMLCALTHKLSDEEKKKQIKSKYSYDKLKNPNNGTASLEEFAKKPQFLRWYIEWSDEFCAERQKKEKEVEKECKKDYDGCKDTNGRSNCVSACKDYEEYITKKKTQYESQKGKFDDEKSGDKPEYKDYSNQEPPEYLQKECLDHSCSCMENVKDNFDYWEKPHTTYKDGNLQNRCICPTSPCEIVDKALGDKTSKSYAEGCKWKYDTTRRNLGVWECKASGDKKGTGSEEDSVCIPPRRRRLFLKTLHDMTGGESLVQLREAFIKCAAVETFFSWHEYKKEKEREEKEEHEQDVTYTPSAEKNFQNELERGNIPEEFKRQMFYTLGDYRDILYNGDTVNGANTGTARSADTDTLKNKIDKVFQNGDKKPSENARSEWWERYGPHIWDGMICALSYDTKTKEKNEKVKASLIDGNAKNKNNYNDVSFQGGFDDGDSTSKPMTTHAAKDAHRTTTTKLENFIKRPTFFRWLEEWADEFCRKRKHKLQEAKKSCRGERGENNCDDDGFDCDEMCPKKDGSFDSFKCVSCAKSCKSYKKWIHAKRNEFNKQKERYEKKIKNDNSTSDSIYDNGFYKSLQAYKKAKDFLENIKDGPCSKTNNGGSKIEFKEEGETFKHAQHCSPCSTIGFKCTGHDSSGVTKNACNKTTFKFTEDNKDTKEDSEQVGILVSDNKVQSFEDGLEDCRTSGIFTGIKENKWSCAYVCGVDACELITPDGKKVGEKQNILIRALFKRWLESFLGDYNKINDKISHCMKNGEGSTCISGCQNKCNCVYKWIEKKKVEWTKIRNRYIKQYSNNHLDYVYEVKSFLQGGPFYSDVNKAIEPFKKLIDFEDTCGGTDHENSEKKDGTKKDLVECLLHKLKREIESCKKKHKETTVNTCSQPPPSDTTHISDDILPPGDVAPLFCNVPSNPCSDETATNVVSVKEVAEEMQREAHDLMLERSHNDGKGGEKLDESVLRGNIEKAQIKGGKPNGLTNDVCSVKQEHSNAIGESTNPCNGKDNNDKMFELKEGWKSGKDVSEKHKDLFLPPRREYMCTSNLENIQVDNVTKKGNVNASFLVDVLLAAKEQADFIKKKYNNKQKSNGFNDNATICRAMKYSFADLGDIIRGKDMWDKDKGSTERENKLKEIFGEIKKKLNCTLGDKYDKDNDPNHTKLRSDWWEANRRQVWNAMKCHTSGMNCDRDTPIDDYIPQRLRWMTEWAEWYCKAQKEAYEELVKECEECKSGTCTSGNGNADQKCTECTTACKAYNTKIDTWKQQWETISRKYEELYTKAKNSDTTTSNDDPKDEKDVVDFLSKLYDKNKESNKIYESAEGYVHQEAHISECQKQTQFCEQKNGETPSSSKENDKEYAFGKYPYDHHGKCTCEDKKPEAPRRPRPFTPLPPSTDGPCDIVNGILTDKGEKVEIEKCNGKYKERNDTYTPWKCDESKINCEEECACMPPRRQELFLNNLQNLSNETSDGVRKAFIECAAIETFCLWHKYKTDNNGSDAQETLNNGIIPGEFKRQMFYTFGDYRDIFFGKDIGSNGVKDISDKVYSILNNGKNGATKMVPHIWWNEYGPTIWEGMLCALTHDLDEEDIKTQIKEKYSYHKLKKHPNGISSLEDFASRPTFLRWFTEWSDQFCKEQTKQLEILKGKCPQETCKNGEDTKKEQCKEGCLNYTSWLQKWKENYNIQSQKYFVDKSASKFNETPAKDDVTASKYAYEYLQKALQKICANGDCKCMEQTSTQHNKENSDTAATHDAHMPASLDEVPHDYKNKCTCPDPETQHNEDDKVAPAPEPRSPPHPAPKRPKQQPKERDFPTPHLNKAMLSSTIMWSVGISFAALTYWLLKKKTKSSVDMLRVLQIPKSDYDIPTLKSKNRYVPYRSAQYRGKRYIYLEGDSGTDSGYTDHYSDITSSSESEYEELDINDIYVPGSPKYKTLIEVVLEPSKRDIQNDIPNDIQNDIPSSDTSGNKFTDNEWNTLKDEFISQYLQSEPNDMLNDYTSGNSSTNTNNTTPSHDNVDNNTHPTPSRHNVDNNNHPTPSRHTLDQKPFIMSIHDRNLYTGEEYSYNVNMSTNTNNDIPISSKNNVYSGIDLINDSLNSGNQHIDIYDEILKRKENELFGTKHHPKNITFNSVAKNTNSDPITNQLELFHKWLDRHRDMCEKLKNDNERLAKLKGKWENDNNNNSGNKTSGNITPNSDNTPPNSDIHSGKLSGTPSGNNIHSGNIHPNDIPSGKLSDIHSGKLSDISSDNNIHSDIQTSDIHSGNKHSDIPSGKLSDTPSGKLSDIPSGKLSDTPSGNKTLNTDVSIQIDMNNPKTTDEFTYVDNNPNRVDDNIYLDTYPDKYTVDNINPNLVGNQNPNIMLPSNPNFVENQNPNFVGNINPVDETPTNPNPNHVQIQMSVKNNQMIKEKYPIGDVWDI